MGDGANHALRGLTTGTKNRQWSIFCLDTDDFFAARRYSLTNNSEPTMVREPLNHKSMKLMLEHTRYWASIGWDILHGRSSQGIYVLGYVKSGTNWLCHLLSGILGIPILEAWTIRLPALHPCIYHIHRFIPIESVRKRTIYIMRDGRDTLVSYYFHIVRDQGKDKQRAERYIGRPLTFDNIRENLPDFIRYIQNHRYSSVDWRTHIETWQRHRERYVVIRYEDMLADTAGEVSRGIEELTGKRPDAERVRSIVQQQDFRTVTKRERGLQDNNEFMRKGINGDWRNHFSRAAAEKFNEYAGSLLFDLNYESDPDWTSKVPE